MLGVQKYKYKENKFLNFVRRKAYHECPMQTILYHFKRDMLEWMKAKRHQYMQRP